MPGQPNPELSTTIDETFPVEAVTYRLSNGDGYMRLWESHDKACGSWYKFTPTSWKLVTDASPMHLHLESLWSTK